MDTEKLNNQFLTGLFPTGKENETGLKEVLHSYPYFQLVQVLYAKKKYDDNNPGAMNFIKFASVYAPDRKTMYVLLKKKNELPLAISKPSKPYQAPVIELIKNTKPTTIAETEYMPPAQTEPGIKPSKAETQTFAPEQSEQPIDLAKLNFTFSSWLKVLPEISGRDGMRAASTQKQIIDKFLEEIPKIARPKAEFFSPGKAAKMSITDNDDIVSETLAKIYFEQGNLGKALKAYQKLLADNPEKKNIFAPRIEEIKTLMSS